MGIKIRAKFTVQEITLHGGGAKLTARPVYGGSKENDKYFEATPGGLLELDVLRPAVLEDVAVGSEFYVDLIPA